jgi:hypothetical protein
MKMRMRIIVLALLSILTIFGHSNPVLSDSPFTFVVVADMRYYSGPGTYNTCEYFKGVCEAINATGKGIFMVSPGDIDPTVDVKWTITDTLASSYLWYPAVGNHELPNAGSESYPGANMDWLRDYDYDANGVGIPPDIVNTGPAGCPKTTYSFDYENAHFVVLNEYCDVGGDTVTDGDIPDHLYNWLVADLATTSKAFIFVFGHEPAYPQPDADNGRIRHLGDSLDKYLTNRDRFWNLLRTEEVTAYICGHTHNHSAVRINGVWQIDVGHARGQGDTGARSTFLKVSVSNNQVTYETYRVNTDDYCEYLLTSQWGTDSTAVTLRSFSARASSRSSIAWPFTVILGGLIALIGGLTLVARDRATALVVEGGARATVPVGDDSTRDPPGA